MAVAEAVDIDVTGDEADARDIIVTVLVEVTLIDAVDISEFLIDTAADGEFWPVVMAFVLAVALPVNELELIAVAVTLAEVEPFNVTI